MFPFLGKVVSRGWLAFLLAWIGLMVGSWVAAPPWGDVAQDREFGFLPASAPSRVAEEEFNKAFPDEQLGSNVVLIVEDPGAGQLDRDLKFVDNVIEPGLREVAKSEGGLAGEAPPSEEPLFGAAPAKPPKPAPNHSIISRIRTPSAPGTGALLVSPDGKALLVVMELTTELMSHTNWSVITKVEDFVRALHRDGRIPDGIRVGITGSAVIGRDQSYARLQSAHATEFWTVLLVVGLLVVIYRAPLLALIPLLTVYFAVQVSIHLLAILAGKGVVNLFEGIQIYITVLGYGAGVDYCLFLMARYKEELDHGATAGDAIAHALGHVGAALVASAATVMCGIGMMVFAEFGKFHEAGYAVPFSLFIALCATLTFSASLLRLAGRWAFWPFVPRPAAPAAAPVPPKRRPWRRFFQPGGAFYRGWMWMSHALLHRPFAIWGGTVAVMLPFAVAAGLLSGELSYDLVGNLPADAPSVDGTQMLQQHFPAGMMGPITVLAVNPHVDFSTPQGGALVRELTDRLKRQRDELGIADIRSLADPLGVTAASKRAFAGIKVSAEERAAATHRAAVERYTTDFGERAKIGTRLDIILQDSPFARRSVRELDRVQKALRDDLPGALRDGTQLYLLGATASMRDLRGVMDRDHTRIFILVLVSVFVILVLLLRRPLISFYLVLSVLFSYYATLGVTFAVFYAVNPGGFSGLDWKVAIFLFTILIAVGEDYNIFLMARIDEEQRRHGLLHGVTEALSRTGPIISSCGIIMAGTFVSLMAGTLSEMKQLGFALAFGVLLDTFVVRPILVPAFLIVLYRWRSRGPGAQDRPPPHPGNVLAAPPQGRQVGGS
jgi:RND superfamily putative drug exporter